MSSAHGMQDGFPDAAQMAALDFLRCGAAGAPGLAIKAAGSADAKAEAFSYRLGGRVYAKAAQATVSLAGLGTIANGASATAFLTINAAGDVGLMAVAPSETGVTSVPQPASGRCLWGAVTVANASGAVMTAGTTALDASGLTVTYSGLSGIVPGEAL